MSVHFQKLMAIFYDSAQFIIMCVNISLFVLRLSATYPFKVGLTGVAIQEFQSVFWYSIGYFIAFLVLRIYQVVSNKLSVDMNARERNVLIHPSKDAYIRMQSVV